MARLRWFRGSAIALVVLVATSLPVPIAEAVATRAPIWSSTFEPPSGASESAIAVNPLGGTVYVGGRISSAPGKFVIAAYATGTGDLRWLVRHPSESWATTDCWLRSLAVAPDGNTLFWTGATFARDGSGDWATMAMDTATGATRWVSRIPNPTVWTPSLVMSPAGNRVFVAGSVRANGQGTRVVAYDAATGDELWRVRLSGSIDERPLGVSPGGGRLFVALGRRQLGEPLTHVAVLALDPSLGSVVWERSFGRGNAFYEIPADLMVDPLGKRIYVPVIRESSDDSGFRPPVVLAYGTTNGGRQWIARNDGIFSTPAVDVVASSEHVFVTDGDVVVSHAARTGRREWGTGAHRLGQDWWSYAAGLAVSPDGGRLFFNGSFENTASTGARLVTIGLNGTTGAVRWFAVRRITRGGGQVVVGPSGGRVFVAGSLFDGDSNPDRGFVTMAYPS
jgi:outer membrane protein assembly factor BamB